MRYEGSIEAPVRREKFYAFVTDPNRVIGCLPDVVDSKVADSDHFTVKARVGAGPMKGTLDMSFETVERRMGSLSKLVGHAQGMQSSVDITLQIMLEDSPNGSKANWVAEASVGGLLASLGGRLIDGVASKYVRQITESMRKQVSA
jgi:carbon monoxide dehydrogenase subunit G